MPARSKARATPQQDLNTPDTEAKTTPQSPEAALMAAAGGGNQAVLAMMGGGDGGNGGNGGAGEPAPHGRGPAQALGGFLSQMERSFGIDGLELIDGPAGAAGVGSEAVATIQGAKVFLSPVFAQLPREKQEEVVAHEVAHGGQKESENPSGGEAATEADAQQAAEAALMGRPAQLALGAAPQDAQDYSLREAWSDVSGAASAVGGAIMDWGLDQINNAADLLTYIGAVGEEAAKVLIDQLIAHKEEIIISFITANPLNGLVVYIVKKLPSETVQSWFAALDLETAGKVIAALAAAGIIATLAPAIFALGTAAFPLLKELQGPAIAALWNVAPDDMKAYAAHLLVEGWPVGLGVAFDAMVGATFGYPVFLDGEAFFEVSHFSEGNFKLKRGGSLTGGLDTGVGAGGFVGIGGDGKGGGKGGGSGEGGLGVGGEVGAQARAGLQVKVLQEFDFPVKTDNAFAAFLIGVTNSDMTTSMSILSQLTPVVGRVNPMGYNTMTKMEVKGVADANAGAFGGVRTAGANTQQGGSTWNNQDGARDNGTTNWWQRWASASVFARIRAEAGVGMEMRNKEFTVNDGGERVPSVMEVDVYGEASAALAIVHAVPVISQALPQVPSFDGGVGIKATWTLRGAPNDTEPQISEPTWRLYGKTGELDRYQGAASETSIALSNLNPETFASIESFLANIQAGSTFKRRFSLGTTLGRKYVLAAQRQGGFNVLLPAEYTRYGFRIEGYLDLEAELSAEQVRSIFRSITSVVSSYADGGAPLQQLYTDVLSFLSTGRGPAHVTAELTNVANSVLRGLKTLHMHGLVGLSVAAGAKISAGAKARLQGRIGGQLTMDQNLLTWAQGEVTVSDIESLIKNAVAAGTGATEIEGSDTSSAPTGDGG